MTQSQHQILNPEPKHVSVMEYNLFHTPLQSFVFIYAFLSANLVGLPKKIKNYCPRGNRIQCQPREPDGKGETTASFSLLRRASHLPECASYHRDHFPHRVSIHSTRGGQCIIYSAVHTLPPSLFCLVVCCAVKTHSSTLALLSILHHGASQRTGEKLAPQLTVCRSSFCSTRSLTATA